MREGWGTPFEGPFAPDWDEIEARAQRIFADALDPEFLRVATHHDVADAVAALCREESENVISMQDLMVHLPPSPGICHAVGLAIRRYKLAMLAPPVLRGVISLPR